MRSQKKRKKRKDEEKNNVKRDNKCKWGEKGKKGVRE
jgi:hypothetical protein